MKAGGFFMPAVPACYDADAPRATVGRESPGPKGPGLLVSGLTFDSGPAYCEGPATDCRAQKRGPTPLLAGEGEVSGERP
jgi:hypothetical protein